MCRVPLCRRRTGHLVALQLRGGQFDPSGDTFFDLYGRAGSMPQELTMLYLILEVGACQEPAGMPEPDGLFRSRAACGALASLLAA